MAIGRNTRNGRQEKGDEEIRAIAEEIYQKRLATGTPGDDLSDWLEAEKSVKAGKISKKSHIEL